MSVCRECGVELRRRIGRAWWMRVFFPNSVRMQCTMCGARNVLLRGEKSKI